MGRTGAYTMLQDSDGDFGVPIADPEAFDAFRDDHDIDAIVEWEYDDEDEYPRVERQVLYGFCPNRIEDDFKFFIKNVHVKRDGPTGFEDFWEGVAAFCEPFTFYHAGADNHFPDLARPYYRDHIDMSVYRVESDDAGTIDVTEIEYVPQEQED